MDLPCSQLAAASLVESIRTELAAVGTPERAERERAYLKHVYEHHLGVDVPTMRTITRRLAKDAKLDHDALIDVVTRLWEARIFELRSAAVELLDRHPKLLVAADVAVIEGLLRTAKTWALVDVLAEHVVGRLLERAPELAATLDRWSVDGDFWIRRSAMLALLYGLRRGGGDFERFGRYADGMLAETEFFVRKAIGWILRETSKERPELVVAWMRPRVGRMAGLTFREAVRHLPDADREALTAERVRLSTGAPTSSS